MIDGFEQNYRVYVQRDFARLGHGLWLYQYDLRNRKTYAAEPVELTMSEVAPGAAVEPTLFLPGDLPARFRDAFVEAFAGTPISSELRGDYEHERSRVDKLMGTLMNLATYPGSYRAGEDS